MAPPAGCNQGRRAAVTCLVCALLSLAAGCARPASPGDAHPPEVEEGVVVANLAALAADSMEGRATGSAGAARAARLLARRLREYGVDPAFPQRPGDSAYFQPVPLALRPRAGGAPRPALLSALSDLDSVPPERRLRDVNVVGVVRGSDPALRDEAVLVGAHFDHVGVGRPVNGDSIYNGADDDASGVVAVLEAARALAAGPRPKRTVVFLLTTGEEVGLLGTRWYIRDPVVPMARTVADLQVEMIARPDPLLGGPGRAMLTGYERSTLGERLANAGVPVAPDPRPEQRFFLRSDNIAFACLGIPAHTLSSYGMHSDYHTPADEAERADAAHLARVVAAVVQAVRLLADGPAPRWNPDGDPSSDPLCNRFR